MKRILIVDDEPAVSDVVEFALRRAGLEVATVRTLAAARRALGRAGFEVDLVVLDLGLPDGDGMELCRELGDTVPVLILTCRDDEIDRVLGLEQGADDYVVKPFSPREVLARVRNLLKRRATAPDANTLQVGAVRLKIDEHRVAVGDVQVPLTPREFDVLRTLMGSPTRVFTRELLIEHAYRGEALVSGRTVDSHIKGIRRKFAEHGVAVDPIETVFGVGYRAGGGPP